MPRALRPLPALLTALALLAFAGYFAVYLVYTGALLNFPFDYDQGEGFELYDTILMSQGQWPYRDNAVYPFYASNYPPLYHVLILPLVPFTGATYFAGRLVAFWGTLLTGAAIAGIVRRELKPRQPAPAPASPARALPLGQGQALPLLAAGAWYASNYVYHIGPLLRQHMLMVMFETLAVAFVARSVGASGSRPGPRGGRALVAALACVLAAGYTKQLAVGTAAAVLAFIFLRGPRRGLVAGALTALVAGAIFLALDLATGHQWYVNIIAANINEFRPEQARALYEQWFRLHGFLIVPALGLLLYELYWDRLSAYSVWLAAAIGIAALSGKWGAGESYFVTAVTATCVCGTLALGRAWNWAAARGARLAWVAGVLVPLLFLGYAASVVHYPTEPVIFRVTAATLGLPADAPYFDSVGYTQIGRPPDQADIDGGRTIAAYVRDLPGPALSEDAGFSLYAGKPVVGNPTQLLNLWKNGLLDSSALVDMIRRQEFGVVVFRAQFYPGPVLDAIYTFYEPKYAIHMNGFEYTLMTRRQP
jgi:hypothetical protein